MLILFFGACEKDQIGTLNCDDFKTALIQEDEAIVRSEIEKLTPDLHPSPTPEDNIGHMTNLQILAERISANCDDITASILCYACIETYPLGSELTVEFLLEENLISKTIIIVTSENDILRFGGLHQ